ncbi:MAG TPA: RHS repeat-associated core domain-containing protein [Candidatus Angelobacter sp.]|nr:RHS repeat-associated core domain-containing protein [Candidatus Angelobacter sp.]
MTYDALGNILNDGLGNTFTYDAESRLITVVNSGGTYNYTYDAEGRRVRNNTSEFLYDLSGRAITLFGATGIWNYGEIYAGGRHLATYSGSTTNFLHSDWLGTKRVMSSISGTNSQTCTSLPFGDGSSCIGTEWNFNHFTDDVHDSESNLEHTWFRQLSSTQGRWTSPDPYLGSMDFGDPQSLNHYVYVLNSPTNMIDPLGFSHVKQPAVHVDNSCTLNGMMASCDLVMSLINTGAAAQCPGNDCSAIFANNQWNFPLQTGPSGQFQAYIPGYTFTRNGGWIFGVGKGGWVNYSNPTLLPNLIPATPTVSSIPPAVPEMTAIPPLPSLEKRTNSHSYLEFLSCSMPQMVENLQKNSKAMVAVINGTLIAGVVTKKPAFVVGGFGAFVGLTMVPALETRAKCNDIVGGVIPRPSW